MIVVAGRAKTDRLSEKLTGDALSPGRLFC
jgi:hypothetical protein